jgi:hypothetical protein
MDSFPHSLILKVLSLPIVLLQLFDYGLRFGRIRSQKKPQSRLRPIEPPHSVEARNYSKYDIAGFYSAFCKGEGL